jgi:hypothetical protein
LSPTAGPSTGSSTGQIEKGRDRLARSRTAARRNPR